LSRCGLAHAAWGLGRHAQRTGTSPRSTSRALSVSASVLNSPSVRTWPSAISWRSTPRHCARDVGADAEGGQPLVAVLRHLVGELAAQHVDQVAGAEALAAGLVEAVDAAQRLARRLGGVPGGRRCRQLSQLPQGSLASPK
jgi:hypothetical protein